MTVREVLTHASMAIARRDAELLLGHSLGRERPWLLAHPEAPLPDAIATRFAALVTRRSAHEPVQYLTGHQEFFGLDLDVTPDVLIPRPETELLVESVLTWAYAWQPSSTEGEAPGPRPLRIVDVGTGSGAVALALAKHLSEAEITAVDLSPAALALAAANAVRLGFNKHIHFKQSDLLAELEAKAAFGPRWDVIVSNPPYIPQRDAADLQPEVRDFEPHLALFAGEDGLEVYHRLIPQAKVALRPGGLLALEFGFGQQPALAELLRDWRHVRFLNDLAGIPRVVLAEGR